MELILNEYSQAFGISFLCVCIIKYVFVTIIKGILGNISLTNYKKNLEFCEKYIYWLLPLVFALILAFTKPIDKFINDIIVYYGLQLLIFNALFKTIINDLKRKKNG